MILQAVFEIENADFPLLLSDTTPQDPDSVLRAKAILERRMSREPLEYILSRAWFCGLPFYVTKDTLIPQADTEVVCEQVLRRLKNGARIADVCTGSGCIALSLLAQTEDTKAVGYDLSGAALAVAAQNADILGLSSRFEPILADVFAPDFMQNDGLFDVIVSNPPYIRTDVIETLSPEVLAEPRMALDGGKDGLDFYRRLIEVCPSHIRDGGALIFEIGYDERESLLALCAKKGLSPIFYRDFGGNDRVCVISI